jgi:hypothetical protein
MITTKRNMNAALRSKRNAAHKDRKRAVKRDRVNNAAIWRIINTGV